MQKVILIFTVRERQTSHHISIHTKVLSSEAFSVILTQAIQSVTNLKYLEKRKFIYTKKRFIY
jgi:hypothetical protein